MRPRKGADLVDQLVRHPGREELRESAAAVRDPERRVAAPTSSRAVWTSFSRTGSSFVSDAIWSTASDSAANAASFDPTFQAYGRLGGMPDVDGVVEQLERDGFAVLEHYLSADDVAAKKADLARVLASNPTGRNDFEGFSTQRIYALFAKTRTFDAQATDPLILGVLERILGPGFQLSAPVGISIGPGEKAQPVHTDDGVYPVPRPHAHLVVNTMWALDDFTEENGATIVVPGSHTGGRASVRRRTRRRSAP